MVPTVTEGRVDGKIIYSVWTGQGQASGFESAVHFQILLPSKMSKSSQNPGQVEKRIKKKKPKLLHIKLYLSKLKTELRWLKY